MRRLSRRRFIAWLLAGSASIWANAACVPLTQWRTPGTPAPSSASQPAPTSTETPLVAATSFPVFRLTAPPESGRITPTERFYVLKYSDTIPIGDLKVWGLQIAGLVERTLTLTWNDVMARQQIEVMRTLECISNPAGGGLIGNATWQGISLRDLLTEAGLKSSARFVTFEGQDEYYTTVPLERAMDEQALLVHRMNGAPLTSDHGFPMRVLLTGVYGQKQPKWISRVFVTDQDEKGPWEKKGWSDAAAIKVNSRIESPDDGSELKLGQRALVAGMAFSGPSGIQRVEVSTDRGQSWETVTLVPGPSPFEKVVWTGWYLWWTPAQSGRHSIQARATDGDGNLQGEEQKRGILGGVFPNGTSAIHQVQVSVVE